MSRLLREGRTALGNLLSPKREIDLEKIWKDRGGSCRVERPASWLNSTADVSVIIPCYNNAGFLPQCLQSVLEQEGDFRLEVVVIDDGSTDETPRVLRPYQDYSQVVLLRQENRGHSGARNAGLERCGGEYILFHDSDDTMCPGALNALLTKARQEDADIVAGGYRCLTPEGQTRPGRSFPEGRVTDPYVIPGMTCGKLFRRRLFQNLRFPEGYWYEDSVICQILLPMAREIHTVSVPVFRYLLNPQGVSAASQGQPRALESLYVTRRLLAERGAFGLTPDEAFFTHFLHMVLLTYHRTRRISREICYPVFLAQQALLNQYFQSVPGEKGYEPLARALRKGQYRRYILLCEGMWLGGK